MAEARSTTQLPLGAMDKSVLQVELEAFREGVALGRQAAELAFRKLAAWAEENPGQLVLAGLAIGFGLGRLLFRRRVSALSSGPGRPHHGLRAR
jgi:hypothetical protein